MANTQENLIEHYHSEGYKNWFNPIDFEVAAESKCDECGHKGLKFTGFQGFGERIAIASCPKCKHQFEF